MKIFDGLGRLVNKVGNRSEFGLGEKVRIQGLSTVYRVQDIKEGSTFPLYRLKPDSSAWYDEFELVSEEENDMSKFTNGMLFASNGQIYRVIDHNETSDNVEYLIAVDSGKVTEKDIESGILPSIRYDSTGRAFISGASKFKIGDKVRVRWMANIPENYKTIIAIHYEQGEFNYVMDDKTQFSEDVVLA